MRIRTVLGGATAVAAILAGSSAAEEYVYDVHGRLTVVKRSGAQTSYGYDPNDNRTQKVIAVPGAPVATQDAIQTVVNTAVTVDPRENDVDGAGDALTITAKTNGTNGTVTLNGSTSVTYTPATNFTGTDSFTYTISDGTNTAVGTVNVIVASTNRPPNAGPDRIKTAKNTSHNFNPRTNDSDPDGDSLTITGKTDGANGTVTIVSSTSLTYQPNTNFEGADSFTYTISDGKGGTATTTVVVNVNAAPVAVNDSLSGMRNVPTTIDPRVNDTDVNNDPLTITAKTNGTNGTVTFTGASVTYTPNSPSWSGTDSFTYTVSDGSLTSNGTVNVTYAANAAPVAMADNATTSKNVALPLDPRANDTDPNSDALTITGKTDGTNGAVSYTATSVTYTPATNFVGSDSFTYTISDGNGGTDVGTVYMTVTANGAPNAVDDGLFASGSAATNSVGYANPETFDPRTNDTDPDSGQTLTIIAVTQGASGTVTFTGTSVTYTDTTGAQAPGGFADSFTYTVSDGNGGTDTATVEVTVSISEN